VVLGNLGAVYLQLGRLEEAEERLLQALEKAPAHQFQWRLNLARLYRRQMRLDQALQQAEAAFRLEPENVQVEQLLQSLRRLLEEEGQ
jgi:tetratricopeptide (TPR) repeat protein